MCTTHNRQKLLVFIGVTNTYILFVAGTASDDIMQVVLFVAVRLIGILVVTVLICVIALKNTKNILK